MHDHLCDCGEPTPYDDWRCDECREREDDQDRPKLPSADDVWEVAKTMPASATWADALLEWKRRNRVDADDQAAHEKAPRLDLTFERKAQGVGAGGLKMSGGSVSQLR